MPCGRFGGGGGGGGGGAGMCPFCPPLDPALKDGKHLPIIHLQDPDLIAWLICSKLGPTKQACY